MKFPEALRRHGWTEIAHDWEYAKGDWSLRGDTSSWWILGTRGNPRVPDVSGPGEYTDAAADRTVRLIEHLCELEDERQRLRRALERVRDGEQPTGPAPNPVSTSKPESAPYDIQPHLEDHLRLMADEHARLKGALARIDAAPDATAARAIAEEALAACYHTWLIDLDLPPGRPDKNYCPICGQRSSAARPDRGSCP